MIPLVRPMHPGRDAVWGYFKKALDSGQISNFGPLYHEAVRRVEKMSDGGAKAILCNNGTSAIRVALQSVLPRGSRVLIPDYTHMGTMSAVVSAGMIPVLGSCEIKTWTLSEESIERAATTCAGMVVVSPFGYRVDFARYNRLASLAGMKLVYDLAGASGIKAETLWPVTYSLHATKNISCGEGGIVIFRDALQRDYARRMMNFDTLPDRSIGSPWGDNLKPSELACAVFLAQLDRQGRIMARIERKRRLISWYQKELSEHVVPFDLHEGNAAPSLCVLAGLPAQELEEAGPRLGATLKRYYIPLSEMPGLERVERLGASSPFFRTCLALPGDVTQEQAEKVVYVVRSFLKNKRRRK